MDNPNEVRFKCPHCGYESPRWSGTPAQVISYIDDVFTAFTVVRAMENIRAGRFLNNLLKPLR